jgi:Xaa-Pro aminopeptidase
MDQDRIDRIRTALRQAKLDALVLRLPENIVMAFGVWPLNGFSYAVFTAEAGPAALLAPSCEDEETIDCWAADVRCFTWPRLDMRDPLAALKDFVQDVVRRHRLSRVRIGYEGSFECVAPPHNACEPIVPCESSNAHLQSLIPWARWSDATSLLYRLRALKTEAEIARLRVAQRVAAFGLERFHEVVAPGLTEAQLAAAVYEACLVRGVRLRQARHINVYPQVSSGPNAHRAWRPVVTTGARRLREGEIALLELAVCVDGFWADLTRVKAAGRPTALQQAVFATVKSAQKAALAAIEPGVEARMPHEAATGTIIKAGFEKYMVHLTGHGLGFRYHEPEPFLMPGNTMTLRAGHVCSVEPGLYDPAFGGIRLEDNVVVTEKGVQNLTKAAKTL